MDTSEEIECNNCGRQILFGINDDDEEGYDVNGDIIKIEELCDDITYYCQECSDEPQRCSCRQCDILSGSDQYTTTYTWNRDNQKWLQIDNHDHDSY